MIKRNFKPTSGLTIIETLIYVIIFTLVVGAITAFTLNLNSSRLRTQSTLEVNDQGAGIARLMTRVVRSANSINVPLAGESGSSLSVSIGNTPVAFAVNDGVLYYTEGVDAPIALSNNKVKIEKLLFLNLSRPSTPGVIKISYKISNATSSTRAEEHYSVDFNLTAAIR